MNTEQETETAEAPYRRLNVVPDRVCAECIHHRRDYPEWICKAGDKETSTVTGKWWYVTKCCDKNEAGDCDGFEQIDHEAVEEVRRRKARVEAWWALAALLLIAAILASAIYWPRGA